MHPATVDKGGRDRQAGAVQVHRSPAPRGGAVLDAVGGVTGVVLGLLAAWLPRRLWHEWEGQLPIERMAAPAGFTAMLAAALIGLGGFLDYAQTAASALTDAALEVGARPGAHGNQVAMPLLASSTSLFAFVFFTPLGLLSLYLGTSGVLRLAAALTEHPIGDPLLTGLWDVGTTSYRKLTRTQDELRRHRLEGEAVPDVLVAASEIGIPDAELVVIASREKPGWDKGTFVVTPERWYRIGPRVDRRLAGGLRALYPLSEVGAAEIIRRSVAYELPMLSTYDARTRRTQLIEDPTEASRAWRETRR